MREIKARLLASYPSGLSFEPMTLRLLRKIFPNLDDDAIASLKNEMLENDSLWFFPEQITDAETQLEIGCQAEEWLAAPGFFSFGALFAQFKAYLTHCRDVETFGRFFDKIQLVSAASVKVGSCRFLSVPGDDNRLLSECAATLVEYVETEGGEIAEETLLEANPYLDTAALATLLTEYQRDVLIRAKTDGLPVWRSVAAMAENLPEDFDEVITRVVDQLIELGYGATFSKLEMILSVHYGVRFLEEHNLTENIFLKMVAQHYCGEQQIKWANSKARLVECGGVMMRHRKKNAHMADNPIIGVKGRPISPATWAAFCTCGRNQKYAEAARRIGAGESIENVAASLGLRISNLPRSVNRYHLFFRLCEINGLDPATGKRRRDV